MLDLGEWRHLDRILVAFCFASSGFVPFFFIITILLAVFCEMSSCSEKNHVFFSPDNSFLIKSKSKFAIGAPPLQKIIDQPAFQFSVRARKPRILSRQRINQAFRLNKRNEINYLQQRSSIPLNSVAARNAGWRFLLRVRGVTTRNVNRRSGGCWTSSYHGNWRELVRVTWIPIVGCIAVIPLST